MQYPPRYYISDISLVTAPAEDFQGAPQAPPQQGNPVYLDSFSGGLDNAHKLALFLLTHEYDTGFSTTGSLPDECPRFPEALCDAAVGRLLSCLEAHSVQDGVVLPADPYCQGHIAKLIPDVCAGYPWRAKARAALTVGEKPLFFMEGFTRAVDVALGQGGDNRAPCNATVPSLKYTSEGTLLTSHCAATAADAGFVCLDPNIPTLVSPSTGIAYYTVDPEAQDLTKFTRMSKDGCHSEVYNQRRQQYQNP